MSRKRSWADTINFFPTKRQIQNIRNRQQHFNENEDEESEDGSTQSENSAQNADLSSNESISEGEQFEDQEAPLPGNTPWDKAKVVWHDDNCEVVVQRVAF